VGWQMPTGERGVVSRYWFGATGRSGSLWYEGFRALAIAESDASDIAIAFSALRGRSAESAARITAIPTSSAASAAAATSAAAALKATGPAQPFGDYSQLVPAAGVAADPADPFIGAVVQDDKGERIALLYADLLIGGGGTLVPLAFNVDTRQILDGSLLDSGNLLDGAHDQLVIGGLTAATRLDTALAGYEDIVFLDGNTYSLSSGDSGVAAGGTLTVTAAALGKGHGLSFDGSGEKDGRFLLEGGAGSDDFRGGAGADRIIGGGGADRLAGGSGADRFVYGSSAESTGASYDTLVGFDFREDVLDLPVAVTGLGAAVTKGSLSAASFDADLAKALSGLGAGQAALFTADKGDLAGKAFLVVDGNGQAGYQAGADFVFLLDKAVGDLTGTAFFG
jgi:Ca2+-binding RTX toxin-like protein